MTAEVHYSSRWRGGNVATYTAFDSLTRPGGNATGFIQFDFSMSGKWV
jgi:hypothetical protein